MREIEAEFELTQRWHGYSSLAPTVHAALAKIPRENFLPANLQFAAYSNRPLAIGHGQTISQPYIVALMSQLLEIESGDRILEIGTGSGYQTAILAKLASWIYSIEVIEPLQLAAKERLQELQIMNVSLKIGDGYYGWPNQAPFDGIMVTAAAPEIPRALVEQLKPTGRMVIPVGEPHCEQQLIVVEKSTAGTTVEKPVLPVAFVPLIPAA